MRKFERTGEPAKTKSKPAAKAAILVRRGVSVSRLREVIGISGSGIVSFRIDNGRNRAGVLAKIKMKDGRWCITIDGKRFDMASAAWAIHTGAWPRFGYKNVILQRRSDPFDFSLRNLRMAGRP